MKIVPKCHCFFNAFLVDKAKSLTPFTLDSILPSDRRSYYRYQGSITTPGCQETVIWTIFKNTVKMSDAQVI